MKLRKNLVRDCLLAMLVSILISVVNYYFLIPTNYSIAIPAFCIFFLISLLLTTSVTDYTEKSISRKLSAYYIAVCAFAIFVFEAPLVAVLRVEQDAIKSGALFIALISWSIFFILLIACRPKENGKKQ